MFVYNVRDDGTVARWDKNEDPPNTKTPEKADARAGHQKNTHTVDPDDVSLEELHATHPAELVAELDVQAQPGAVVARPANAGGTGVLLGVVAGVEDQMPETARAVARSPSLPVVASYAAGDGVADEGLVGVAALSELVDEAAPPVDGSVEFLPGVSGEGAFEVLAEAELPPSAVEPLVRLPQIEVEDSLAHVVGGSGNSRWATSGCRVVARVVCCVRAHILKTSMESVAVIRSRSVNNEEPPTIPPRFSEGTQNIC